MLDSLTGFWFQLAYLLTHFTTADVIDTILVAIVIFLVLQALRQRRALQLLRGAIIFGILGVALLGLLPLNTFNWLLRGLLLVSVVALPLLFQDELRQALAGLGRVGSRRTGKGSAYGRFKEVMISAVKDLSDRCDGALIVLEGKTPLAEVIETGVRLEAQSLSSELLLSIFHPKTPLHDGAVVLRGDRLVAASCILPVQTEATGAIHLGTRHRAALGLSSEVPDALVIVVSEETGQISVAQSGRLTRDLNSDALEECLDRFQGQIAGQAQTGWQKLFSGSPTTIIRNSTTALALAVVAWVTVIFQTNPPQQITFTDVTLNIGAPSSNLVLMNELPDSLSVNIQAAQDHLETLHVDSFNAVVALSELPAGVHRVPVEVSSADRAAQIISVDPAFLDITLQPRLNNVYSPTVNIADVDSLPPGYVLGELQIFPETVTVQGPQSLVEQVFEATAEVKLSGRRADFQQSIDVFLVDENGDIVEGIQPVPESIVATVPIRRTFYTREIAVNPSLDLNTLEQGYEVKSVNLSPSIVTLTGSRNLLDEAGEFLITAPITLTNVTSNFGVDIPLILPDGVSAIDEEGNTVLNIRAELEIAPVTDYYVMTVRPSVIGITETLSVVLSEYQISVFLRGPEPIIAGIEKDPDLVLLTIDLTDYEPGTYKVDITAVVPKDIQVELFPADVQVTIEER